MAPILIQGCTVRSESSRKREYLCEGIEMAPILIQGCTVNVVGRVDKMSRTISMM